MSETKLYGPPWAEQQSERLSALVSEITAHPGDPVRADAARVTAQQISVAVSGCHHGLEPEEIVKLFREIRALFEIANESDPQPHRPAAPVDLSAEW